MEERGKEKPIIGFSCHCCNFVTDTQLMASFTVSSCASIIWLHQTDGILASIVPIGLASFASSIASVLRSVLCSYLGLIVQLLMFS